MSIEIAQLSNLEDIWPPTEAFLIATSRAIHYVYQCGEVISTSIMDSITVSLQWASASSIDGRRSASTHTGETRFQAWAESDSSTVYAIAVPSSLLSLRDCIRFLLRYGDDIYILPTLLLLVLVKTTSVLRMLTVSLHANHTACTKAFNRGSVKSQAHSSSFPRELPNGAFWLSRESTNNDVIYGQVKALREPKWG